MRISRHNDSEYWHLQRFNADLRRADKGPPEGEEKDLAGDPILDAFSEDMKDLEMCDKCIAKDICKKDVFPIDYSTRANRISM